MEGPIKDWREDRIDKNSHEGYLLDTGKYSDCYIGVGEPIEFFNAHKFVLLRSSRVFENIIFKNPPDEGVDLSYFRIRDIQPGIFKLMMKYMYTEVLTQDISVDNLMSLAVAADKYLLYNLRQNCVHRLATKADIGNVWDILNLAHKLESPTLYNAAQKVVVENTKELISHPKFLTLSRQDLLQTIVKPIHHMDLDCKEEVKNACLRWAKMESQRQGISNIREVLGKEILKFLTLEPEEMDGKQW